MHVWHIWLYVLYCSTPHAAGVTCFTACHDEWSHLRALDGDSCLVRSCSSKRWWWSLSSEPQSGQRIWFSLQYHSYPRWALYTVSPRSVIQIIPLCNEMYARSYFNNASLVTTWTQICMAPSRDCWGQMRCRTALLMILCMNVNSAVHCRWRHLEIVHGSFLGLAWSAQHSDYLQHAPIPLRKCAMHDT